jgi:hypothetical protein
MARVAAPLLPSMMMGLLVVSMVLAPGLRILLGSKE